MRLASGLLIGGLLLNAVATLVHPSGDEDRHRVIFAEYADSGSWVAVHLGQFVGVTVALIGLLVLSHAMRAARRAPVLACLAAAGTVATAAAWALLQGLDGVALKQGVDAWVSASGAQKPVRFANAETVRWLEWGFQSYFRLLLGLTLVLYGAAVLVAGWVARWLGWLAVLAGLCSVVLGVDVGYSGLASIAQDVLGPAFFALVLAFAVGMLATSRAPRSAGTG